MKENKNEQNKGEENFKQWSLRLKTYFLSFSVTVSGEKRRRAGKVCPIKFFVF